MATYDEIQAQRESQRAAIVRGAKPVGNTAVFWVDELRNTRDGKENPTLGWYKCRTPYNREFVEALKIAIPPKHRRFVPSEKVWAIAPASSEAIVNLAAAYYDRIVELTEDPVVKSRGTGRASSTKVRDIKDTLAERSKAVQNVLDEFGPRKVEV